MSSIEIPKRRIAGVLSQTPFGTFALGRSSRNAIFPSIFSSPFIELLDEIIHLAFHSNMLSFLESCRIGNKVNMRFFFTFCSRIIQNCYCMNRNQTFRLLKKYSLKFSLKWLSTAVFISLLSENLSSRNSFFNLISGKSHWEPSPYIRVDGQLL